MELASVSRMNAKTALELAMVALSAITEVPGLTSEDKRRIMSASEHVSEATTFLKATTFEDCPEVVSLRKRWAEEAKQTEEKKPRKKKNVVADR